MADTGDRMFRLVFTAALKDELPLRWLRSSGVGVHHIRALKSGALGRETGGGPNSGVLFVISGVGPRASSEAAEWIRDNVRPLFVVNIGSAGALNDSANIGDWVSPSIACDEDGRTRNIDTRLPFPWPDSVPRSVGGRLLSVERPKAGNLPEDRRPHDYVDMEACAQASVFAGTQTSFHAVKMITDRSGAGTQKEFAASLPMMREGLRSALGFLKGPGAADVSVVIPVHNREDRAAACVESVLAQSLPAREIMVVDDGSTDGTAKRLESYGDRIKIIRSDKNRGPAHARNLGVEHAAGEWIAFLDSDDLWERGKLERQRAFLVSNPFYEILQSEEVWIRDGARVNPRNRHRKPEGWIWRRSLELCLVSPSSVMMRRSLFGESGGFDESLPACEDYDLWIRIGRNHAVGLEPSLSVIKHGGHEDQLSRRYPAMDRFRVRALLKALEAENDPEFASALRAAAREKLAVLAKGARKRNNLETAGEYEAILAALGEAIAGAE